MPTEIWKASDEIQDKVKTLVANHHPDLILAADEIVVLFREKATKKGGKVILGASKKAPAILNILSDVECKFIIELAADEWTTLSDNERNALLDHHLCAFQVEEDPKSGEVKYFIAPPDIGYYYAEYERYGDWRPKQAEEETEVETVDDATAILGTALT